MYVLRSLSQVLPGSRRSTVSKVDEMFEKYSSTSLQKYLFFFPAPKRIPFLGPKKNPMENLRFAGEIVLIE